MAIGKAAMTSARETQRSPRAPPPAPVEPTFAKTAVATPPEAPLDPLGMQMTRKRPPGGTCAAVVQLVVPTGKSPAVVESRERKPLLLPVAARLSAVVADALNEARAFTSGPVR